LHTKERSTENCALDSGNPKAKAGAMKAMKVRFWIEILATVSVIACALALLIASLGAVGAAASDGAGSSKSEQSPVLRQQAYEGVVTDTQCGAKHSADMAKTAGDCTLACVRGGEHFSLVDGDKMYVLEGEPASLKRVAGQRVRITGTLNGKTILVTLVASAL
jgi:hypothetical protein